MIGFDNLYMLQERIDTNPKLIVIYLGCPFQNTLIISNNSQTKMVKRIGTQQEEIFAKIAPHRIVLKHNKRSPSDQPKLEELHEMLFVKNMKCSEVVDFAIKNCWIKELKTMKDIAHENIDQHICYFQAKPLKLSTYIHKEMYAQNISTHELWTGEHFLKHNILKRPIGTRCKVRIGMRKGERVLIVDFGNQKVVLTLKQCQEATTLSEELVSDLDIFISSVFKEIGVCYFLDNF